MMKGSAGGAEGRNIRASLKTEVKNRAEETKADERLRAVAGKKYEIEPRGAKYHVKWMRKTEEGALFPKALLKPLLQQLYEEVGNSDIFTPRQISLRQKDIFWCIIYHYGDIQTGLKKTIIKKLEEKLRFLS